MRGFWWKISGVVLILYTFVAGFLLPVPKLDILNETIRNLYFHVPVWFAMIALVSLSAWHSLRFIQTLSVENDAKANNFAHAGIIFSIMGMLTGALWARFTWGTWWTTDTKLNGVAITFLIYMAYFILRNSVTDQQKKARISAIYNLFAWVMMIVFIMILPRMSASLHPGNGGNPAFGKYDLDNTMRLVFYPAVIGWVLVGIWIAELKWRTAILELKQDEKN